MELDQMKSKTLNWVQQQTLPDRKHLHLARKIWHAVGVTFMLVFYVFAPIHISQITIFAVMLIAVPLDMIRVRAPRWNRVFIKLFRPIMRDSEVQRLAGTSALITGVSILVWAFPREVVILSLAFLGWADPIASYIGIKYGRRKIFKHKSFEGCAAAFFVCFVFSLFFLIFTYGFQFSFIFISLLAGLVGALAEGIPIANVDDNLSMPLLSGIFLWILLGVTHVI